MSDDRIIVSLGTPTPTPEVGKLFRYRGDEGTGGFPQTVLITDVLLSQAPKGQGRCDPPDDEHPATGWFIYFRYPHGRSSEYSTYVGFEDSLGG